MRTSPSLSRLVLCLALGGLLVACAGKRTKPEEPPTLRTLAGREVQVDTEKRVSANEEKAITAYKNFLDAAPRANQRGEAMRRLGDLEMDSADNRIANGTAAGEAADYKVAIGRYQDYLKAYPKDPGNDRVLYQLARAHEQGGELEVALKTLDRLVQEYPDTKFHDEAQFRRGEMLFATRDYVKAEKAFSTVLNDYSRNLYHERSLYMRGWSLFKQQRLEEALHSFFGVLDLKVTVPERFGTPNFNPARPRRRGPGRVVVVVET